MTVRKSNVRTVKRGSRTETLDSHWHQSVKIQCVSVGTDGFSGWSASMGDHMRCSLYISNTVLVSIHISHKLQSAQIYCRNEGNSASPSLIFFCEQENV